ncbi:MAG: hypothetical protein ACYDCB_11205, partial [Candidatus Dormibacteria bacterium]
MAPLPGRGASAAGSGGSLRQRLGRRWLVEFALPEFGESRTGVGGWTTAARSHIVRGGVAARGWVSCSLLGRSQRILDINLDCVRR